MGTVGRPDKNTQRTNKRNVLDALRRGLTLPQAAAETGLAISTVHRYLSDNDFRMELQQQQGDLLDELTRVLTARSLAAVQVLTREMAEGLTPTTRVRAATAIMAEARAHRDNQLETRLRALEQAAAPDLRAVN